MLDVAIVGGSGYAGGEAVRLLLYHPHANVKQVTSERFACKFVRTVHPNLRKRTDLKFTSIADLGKVDCAFIALPHGVAMGKMVSLRGEGRYHHRSQRRLPVERSGRVSEVVRP